MKFTVTEIRPDIWELKTETGIFAKIKYVEKWDIYNLYINGEYNYGYSKFEYCLEAFRTFITNTERVVCSNV